MGKRLKGNLLLLLTAVIWGVSFVSQSVGVERVSPFTFIGIRTTLGGIVLLPVILAADNIKKKNKTFVSQKNNRNLWLGGSVCGILLCTASVIQTYGLKYTTAGKSGFITALYILIVPLIGIFLGRKIRKIIIPGIIAAITGMYFLCLFNNDMAVNRGDIIVLVCSVFFAFHILCVDYFSPKADGIKLSCLQFLVAGVISLILMFINDKPVLSDIISCTVPILYSGIMSCGVAYTLQVVAQKDTEPTVASILMSLESVFAAIAGWIILGDKMSPTEIFGCGLMFFAIILVQLPERSIPNR